MELHATRRKYPQPQNTTAAHDHPKVKFFEEASPTNFKHDHRSPVEHRVCKMAETVFLYKILDVAPADPLPTTLPATELDTHDGFIHLSTATQTRSTADLFFSQSSTLWILQLRARDLDGEIRYSPALADGSGRFPHVHNSRVGLGWNNVEKVIEVSKDGYEKWSSVPALQSLTDD